MQSQVSAGQQAVPGGSLPVISEEEAVAILEEQQVPQSGAQAAAAETPITDKASDAGDSDTWRDLYRVLMDSLKSNSELFAKPLTLETVALGWLGVIRAHDGRRDDVEGPAHFDELQLREWLHYARWADAFDAGITKELAAKWADAKVENIHVYKAVAQPMLPAYIIALNPEYQAVNVVVRGTTTWHDALTDLVAHTEPCMGGFAHTGMLTCARSIISKELHTIAALLDSHPGYSVHCVGHSLGGGVAALIAMLLRNTPQYSQQLRNAADIVCTGLGVPPVIGPQQVAEDCSGYITSVVYNHDLVPRACVATLEVLREELEQSKEAFFADRPVANWLRTSDAMDISRTLAQEAAAYYTSRTPGVYLARLAAKNPNVQNMVKSGLGLVSTLVNAKLKFKGKQEPGGTGGDGTELAAGSLPLASATATVTTAVATPAPGEAPSTPVLAATVEERFTEAPATTSQPPAAQPQADTLARVIPAVPAVAAIAGAGSGSGSPKAPGTPTASGSPRASPLAAAIRASADRRQQQQQQQQQLKGTGDATAEAAAGALQQAQPSEPQPVASITPKSIIHLYSPGQLYLITREGLDANATHGLVKGQKGHRLRKIFLNKCILRDHRLGHYVKAINRLLQPPKEGGDASTPAAATASPVVELVSQPSQRQKPAAAVSGVNDRKLDQEPTDGVPAAGGSRSSGDGADSRTPTVVATDSSPPGQDGGNSTGAGVAAPGSVSAAGMQSSSVLNAATVAAARAKATEAVAASSESVKAAVGVLQGRMAGWWADRQAAAAATAAEKKAP